MNECPKCYHKVNHPAVLYCIKCGSPLKKDDKVEEGRETSTPFVGEKSVIAAENIGNHNLSIKTMGGNVTVDYHDDRGVIRQCDKCGHSFKLEDLCKCKKCGKFVCKNHIDEVTAYCSFCYQEYQAEIEKEYEKKVARALNNDNEIDHAERDEVDKERLRLGISVEKAVEIEHRLKRFNESFGSEFTSQQKLHLSQASELLYRQFDVKGAEKVFGKLNKLHPGNQEVARLYLKICLETEPEKLKKELPLMADSLEKHLAQIELFIREKEFDNAEQKIVSALKSTKDIDRSICLKLKYVEYFVDLYFVERAQLLLDNAENKLCEVERQLTIGDVRDHRAQYWFIKAYLDYAKGDNMALAKGEDECANAGVSPFYFKRKKYFIAQCKKNGDDAFNKSDFISAYKFYLRGAEYNDPYCQNKVGKLLFAGNGIERDYHETMIWYERAAAQGNSEAQYNLGHLYLSGEGGIAQDYAKAMELFISAEKQGVFDAQVYIGIMLRDGLGVDVDKKKAIEWFKTAQKNGNELAKEELKKSDDESSEIFPERKSFEWCLKAAEEGDVEAQYEMGKRYKEGDGIEINERKAFDYFLMAARKNHVKAQVELACMYQKGIGTEKDEQRAFLYFRKAALERNDSAQFNLGKCYLEGIGTEKNDTIAFTWFEKSAKKDNAHGQFQVGRMYWAGKGVKKDTEKALYWLKKSAAQQNEIAINELARLKIAENNGKLEAENRNEAGIRTNVEKVSPTVEVNSIVAQICVQSGLFAGKVYSLKSETTIGRINGEIILEEPSISREHARILFADNQFIIENKSTTNPVKLNDEVVTSRKELRDGDIILLGLVKLQFKLI